MPSTKRPSSLTNADRAGVDYYMALAECMGSDSEFLEIFYLQVFVLVTMDELMDAL